MTGPLFRSRIANGAVNNIHSIYPKTRTFVISSGDLFLRMTFCKDRTMTEGSHTLLSVGFLSEDALNVPLSVPGEKKYR